MKMRALVTICVLAGLGWLCFSLIGCGNVPDLDEKNAKTLDPSGVKYFDVKVGEGAEALRGKVVEVTYSGRLRDATKFVDISDSNKPYRFVIGSSNDPPGFVDGVIGMKSGGQRKLYLTPEQGYGSQSQAVIPPNSDLIYDIKLLKVTPGVEIEDLKVGDGDELKGGALVEVLYTGKLLTNSVFDSSQDRSRPFQFRHGAGMIKGWDLGVLGMKVGGRRRITIQPEFGYGMEPKAAIPPNSVLVFEIELLKVT